jgi:hypothetical protein
VLSGDSPQDTATTFYHEIWHQNQPSGMSWEEKEIEAYVKTEEWTIKKGLPGQAANNALRKQVGGKWVPDPSKVTKYVRKHYPLPSNNKDPIVVGHDPRTGEAILDDYTRRPPKLGDTYAGPRVVKGEKTIPGSVWKCPGDKKAP